MLRYVRAVNGIEQATNYIRNNWRDLIFGNRLEAIIDGATLMTTAKKILLAAEKVFMMNLRLQLFLFQLFITYNTPSVATQQCFYLPSQKCDKWRETLIVNLISQRSQEGIEKIARKMTSDKSEPRTSLVSSLNYNFFLTSMILFSVVIIVSSAIFIY